MIYVTSDWHFSHDKEFIWKSRGYSSIEDMNEGLIQKYNSLIHMDDEIYVLGDCCLGGPYSLVKNKNLIERLNGKLHIAFGNHCTIQRQEMYKSCQNVVETGYAYAFTYRKYHFYASHYPTLCSNYDDEKLYELRLLIFAGILIRLILLRIGIKDVSTIVKQMPTNVIQFFLMTLSKK